MANCFAGEYFRKIAIAGSLFGKQILPYRRSVSQSNKALHLPAILPHSIAAGELEC